MDLAENMMEEAMDIGEFAQGTFVRDEWKCIPPKEGRGSLCMISALVEVSMNGWRRFRAMPIWRILVTAVPRICE